MKVLAAILLSVIMLSSGFFVNSPATAAPNDNANDRAKHVFKLPANAVEIAPGIYHIGTAIHEGKIVDGIAAYHHRPGHDGGPGGGGPGGNGGGEKCFAFFAKGAKWKPETTPDSYLIDPANSAGLDVQKVRTNIADAITTWDPDNNILGTEAQGIVDGIDESQPDGNNEVLFGDVDPNDQNSGALAVTVVWGIFSGPPQGRELIEWGQMYDDTTFQDDWSIEDTAVVAKFDFQSVATHEIGHAIGLTHPSDTCTEETMFRFVDTGEDKKRTLNDGDIAGKQELYG